MALAMEGHGLPRPRFGEAGSEFRVTLMGPIALIPQITREQRYQRPVRSLREAHAQALGEHLQVLLAAYQDVLLAREAEGGLAEAGPGDEPAHIRRPGQARLGGLDPGQEALQVSSTGGLVLPLDLNHPGGIAGRYGVQFDLAIGGLMGNHLPEGGQLDFIGIYLLTPYALRAHVSLCRRGYAGPLT